MAGAGLLAAPLNTDAGYTLVAARRLLQGDRLYVDLIETNPPLIFWLMSLPAWAGIWLPLPDDRLVGLFTAFVLVLCTVTGLRVLSTWIEHPRLVRSAVVCAFVLTVVFPFLDQVGQREQLAAMLTFPYALLAARAASGHQSARALGIWCGVLGGLGVAIKPFFLAAWVGIELVGLAARGWQSIRRAEFITVSVLQVAYLIVVLVATPEYLNRMVPLARELYGAYGIEYGEIVKARRVVMLTVMSLMALAGPRWLKSASAAAMYSPVFGAAAIGWLASHVAQGKGWQYHLLPATVYGVVAFTAAVSAWGSSLVTDRTGSSGQRARLALYALPVLAACVWLVPRIAQVSRDTTRLLRAPYSNTVLEMSHRVQEIAPGEPVYVMSTSVWPAFPLVNLARAAWPYPYHFLWPVPALYGGTRARTPYRAPDRQDPVERQFFESVVTGLVRVPPRLLIVERGPYLQAMRGREFDFVEYFSGSPEFRTLIQRYRRLGFIGRWEFFELR